MCGTNWIVEVFTVSLPNSHLKKCLDHHFILLVKVKYNTGFNSFNPGSFLLDIGKQHSPGCDAAEHGVPSFA